MLTFVFPALVAGGRSVTQEIEGFRIRQLLQSFRKEGSARERHTDVHLSCVRLDRMDWCSRPVALQVAVYYLFPFNFAFDLLTIIGFLQRHHITDEETIKQLQVLTIRVDD
jgi:uncharacterized membrane protein YkvA (DUF1232 family)